MVSLLDGLPAWTGEVALAILVCVILSKFIYRKQSDIPMAKGGLPLLGHALAYQKDPPAFLQEQEHGVFRINLAGREMIVIGSDTHAMKQIATLPESCMSARQAVADIGFEHTLGPLNVYKGTDWHKRILKDAIYSKDQVLYRIFNCLVDAFDKETSGDNNSKTVAMDDLFTLMRRCMLRTMLSYMISPRIVESNEHFIDDFMEFQDRVEDATAKAAVLPRFISLPLVLKPVERKRRELVQQLASILSILWSNDSHGPWMKAFRREPISVNEAAELIVGLMFAAHKNPAIGVAQSFCFLQSEATKEQRETAVLESKRVFREFQNKDATNPLEKAETLRRCVLETMRVTAHSIGALRTAKTNIVLEASNGRTYSIQKGDVIAISHIITNKSTQTWGKDASNFRQDRWDAINNVDEYRYTTFSHGLHKCPGERLALTMMQIMLAILLARDTVLTSDLPNLCFERATIAQRKGKVPITICIKH